MTTVTGYTADRMKQIEDAAIIDGDVVGDNLILTRFNTTTINAGNVRGPAGPAGPGSNTNVIQAISHGFVDGMSDARASIKAAAEAADAAGGGIVAFPVGATIKLLGYVRLENLNDVELDLRGTTVSWASDTGAFDTYATSDSMARSAFLWKNCIRPTVRLGLANSTALSISLLVNLGSFCYFSNTLRPRMIGGEVIGAPAWYHDSNVLDSGGLMAYVTNRSFRQPNVPGDNNSFMFCDFEQPTTTDFNRVGNNGSSHGIYAFAGRYNTRVNGCTFRNIRVDGVKFSGSSLPIIGGIITNNLFDDCANGVLIGEDGSANPVHTNFNISDNTFLNCSTNTDAW